MIIIDHRLFRLFYIFHKLIIFTALTVIIGCANQQPPGGGEEDKTPPKVSIISPKPNSLNFRGKILEFKFNEYIDKRSFQDAFRISPAVKGEIEYNWSGKEVEVKLPGDLEKLEPNKTFVVNISSGLKDIHGNSITEPVNFAFSTGPVIDMAQISGVVYENNKKIVSVFAYRIDNEEKYNPTKNIPDYLTETSADGNYILTNLSSAAKYRVISVIDDDRNLLFTSEREGYGVLPYDITLADSQVVKNANFYLKVIQSQPTVQPELDYSKYFKDSLGIVYISVENDSRVVSPDQSIFIFFKLHTPGREEFVNSLKFTGEDNQQEKMVFNWRNDSLVELFAANKFKQNFKYNINFTLKISADSVYNFAWKFKTVGKNSFGEIKGSVNTNYENINLFDNTVKLDMTAIDLLQVIKYSFDIRDTVYSFVNILEAEYNLFSYIDLNSDNAYNYGYPYPFSNSEPFFVYPGSLRIRGGWTVENVVIGFNK